MVRDPDLRASKEVRFFRISDGRDLQGTPQTQNRETGTSCRMQRRSRKSPLYQFSVSQRTSDCERQTMDGCNWTCYHRPKIDQHSARFPDFSQAYQADRFLGVRSGSCELNLQTAFWWLSTEDLRDFVKRHAVRYYAGNIVAICLKSIKRLRYVVVE